MVKVISHTQSVCPVCLKTIDARRIIQHDGIYMDKRCPEHGEFTTLIWEGDLDSYNSWGKRAFKTDVIPGAYPEKNGCPYDCGLCTHHIRSTCCVLLELTNQCNLSCPVCFASAGGGRDASMEEIAGIYDHLMSHGGPYNIQLSGGEPTVRDDLPEIIKLGQDKGFSFFQLNTNGIRLAEDGYAQELREAGLNTVFLQFDGLRPETFIALRGRDLLQIKERAIQNCGEAGLGVVLVPTVAPDINTGEIGDILKYALSELPHVRGVHFQPMSYFGRNAYRPGQWRITIPYMLREIERQTDGMMKAADFSGGGAENPYCTFHASYMRQRDGTLRALVKKREESACCVSSKQSRDRVSAQWSGVKLVKKGGEPAGEDPGKMVSFDEFLRQAHENTFAVTGMLFQDAYNFDIDRVRRCYLCETDPRYGIVPFCSYNLSAADGRTLYR